MTVGKKDDAQDELAAVATLDRAALGAQWVATFGCPPPHQIRAYMMRLALAWHTQMQALRQTSGPAGPDKIMRGLKRSAAASAPAMVLAPGTRLLREWQGHTHHVTVQSGGFEYGGKTYRSLTAIARQITGTPWSGPLFFGLRK